MFKSNKGFTLVELIVVIAILAILAGVAIPVYNGYIKRSQDAAVITELDAIQTAAQAANATSGQVTLIVVSSDGKTISIGGKDNVLAKSFDGDFCLFYPEATDKATDTYGVFNANIELQGSYKDEGATWENGEWVVGSDKTVPTQTIGSSLGDGSLDDGDGDGNLDDGDGDDNLDDGDGDDNLDDGDGDGDENEDYEGEVVIPGQGDE